MTTTGKYILGSAIVIGVALIFRKQIAGFFNGLTGSSGNGEKERKLGTLLAYRLNASDVCCKKWVECSPNDPSCPEYWRCCAGGDTRTIITPVVYPSGPRPTGGAVDILTGGGNGGGRPIPSGLVS